MTTFGEALLYMLGKEHLAPQYLTKPPPLARFTEADNPMNIAYADIPSKYVKSKACSCPTSPIKAPQMHLSSLSKPSAACEPGSVGCPVSPVEASAPRPTTPNMDCTFPPHAIQQGTLLSPAYASPVHSSSPQCSLLFPPSSNNHGTCPSAALMEADKATLVGYLEGK